MRKQILPVLLMLASLLFPAELQAQDIGNVALRTVSAQLANTVICTGTPQTFSTATPALNALNFRNLGQTAHQASVTSTAAVVTLEIDGLDANGISSRISNPVVTFANGATTSYIAQGSGYYTNIQLSVTCTAAATFTLSYNGSFGSLPTITGAPGAGTFILPSNASQVQGVVPQQTSAGLVNPIISGGLQPAINLGFTATGLDTFNLNPGVLIGNTGVGTFTIGAAPAPTKAGELAVAFEVSAGDNVGGAGVGINAPWACPLNQAQTCIAGDLTFSTLANATAGQLYTRTYKSASATVQDMAIIVDMAGTSTAPRQQSVSSISATSSAMPANTLAGSTIFAIEECTSAGVCTVSGVTDTQGNTYKLIGSLTAPANGISGGMWVFMTTTPSTAAADTVTATVSAGVGKNLQIVEFTGITTAPLSYPAISISVDAIGAALERADALPGNQFVCNVTLSTNTTTQCQAAPTTINGVAVRLYVTDFQINTTVAGTTSTIQLKTGTGANCGTGTANLSAIAYPNTASFVNVTNVLGMRTPLIAPLQSAVCATQAGGVAGTSVVEIHGFLAP